MRGIAQSASQQVLKKLLPSCSLSVAEVAREEDIRGATPSKQALFLFHLLDDCDSTFAWRTRLHRVNRMEEMDSRLCEALPESLCIFIEGLNKDSPISLVVIYYLIRQFFSAS